jgi:hypothetical protein
MAQGDYEFRGDELERLLIATHYPERTDRESHVIRAFLLAHGREFTTIVFGKRLGPGVLPDPAHIPAIQRQTVLNTKRRLDLLCWSRFEPWLVEVKFRITPASLGQMLTYAHFFAEEFPDAPDPKMVVVGQEADEDAVTVLNAHGIDVLVYPDAVPSQPAATGGL